ncbi:MAG: hypothetical protein A2010_09505 [Nitrospirae bacterium GWD2_57_9]|nr:MAG: hypothetical protein A2010_09505 [Nitrospirae bacterium GWD2_57_9]OGW45275.1 MAG: hypothetical protein A2078_07165 [Nitrospirae bacterium GWC2_57_9]
MNRCAPRSFRAAAVLVLAAFILTASGCGYLSFYTRQTTWRKAFENQPRMSLIQRFAPGDLLLINGRINNFEQGRGPLLLAAVSSQYRENEIVALTVIRDPFEGYNLFLAPGDYGFFVFADVNGNSLFERNELVGQTSMLVTAAKGNANNVTEGPAISVDYRNTGKTVFRVRVKVRAADYIYSSLDDEFFDPRYGNAGLYNPAGLMAHTQGFLFGLEDYDERKTMVIFVHGIAGTPRDWKFFVEGMDRARFQPFFLYYPSGMPLEKIGSLLAQFIDSVDKGTGTGRQNIVLAAHSMGGLVSLSAIEKLTAEGFPSSLRLYCSFSTPYGGDPAARAGVENAPAVVPVWRDIAAGSEFLRKVQAQRFPASLPFHLFFSYNDPSSLKLGESSDGSVTLSSQLVPVVQDWAIKVIGFNDSHTGILNSEAARASFLRLLENAAPTAAPAVEEPVSAGNTSAPAEEPVNSDDAPAPLEVNP